MSDTPPDGHTWALHRKALHALVGQQIVLVLKLAGCEAIVPGRLAYVDTEFRLPINGRNWITIHPAGIHSVGDFTITVTR